MIKKTRYCDICGGEIPWHAKRYKFTRFLTSPYCGEEKRSYDLCSDCHSKFIEFVKRSDNNGE